MCGISGIVGSSDITKRLYNCMLNLEYRGYDSCGMAVLSDGKIDVRKNTGRVAEVFEKERFQEVRGATGIAHSRWATHGKPNKVNSHPHISPNGRIAVVHNGIVGNYLQLKEELISKGHVFQSDTDSEVIPQLLQFYYEEQGNFERAVSATMDRLEGTFAFVAIEAGHPGLLFCGRNRNPLIIGTGRDANYVASDIVAFIEYTKNVVYLNDNEYAIISKDRFEVRNASTGEFVHKKINTVAWDAEQARKGGYPHFLLKEIYEQPVALKEALATDEKSIETVAKMMNEASRTYLIGCGTTFYAALLAQYYFKEVAGVFAPAVNSDEFKNLCDVDEGALVIAVSQSGETFDTLEALRYARAKGARTAAIVNALGSSMTREVDFVIMQGAGPEKSVLSTKAMTSQIVILTRIVLSLARMRNSLPTGEIDEIRAGLDEVVGAVRTVLDEKPGFIRKIANRVGMYKKWLFIGRGYHLPAALEAALKLKEVTYIPAEGMSGGFMKHGPISLVDEEMAVVVLMPTPDNVELYKSTFNSVSEMKSRGGRIIAFHFEPKQASFDEQVILPKVHKALAPIPQLVAGQLLAYFIAVLLKRDPDNPRGLAKSVTVE